MIINYLVRGNIYGRCCGCCVGWKKKSSSEDETRKKKRNIVKETCPTFSRWYRLWCRVMKLEKFSLFLLFSASLVRSIFHVKRSVPSIVLTVGHRARRRWWREIFSYFFISTDRPTIAFIAHRKKGNFSARRIANVQ